MKKILITQNLALQGGVEQYTLDIVEGLTKDFELFVMCGDGEMLEKYKQAGAEVVVDTPKCECDFSYSFRVAKFCRQNKISVVHANQLKAGALSIFGAWLARVPKRIYHVHTPITIWKLSRGKKLTTFWLNWAVNWFVGNFLSTDVLALTEATKTSRVGEEKINSHKITIIPNGVRLENFQLTTEKRTQLCRDLREQLGVGEDTILIGTLSRLTEEKGLEFFVGAVSLVESDVSFHAVVGGKGELRSDLESQVKKQGIGGKITFLGFVYNQAEYFPVLDIFVLPSVAEGFGIVLIEALASGCACLISDLPVLQEVGGDAVLVFESKNPSSLAKKLGLLLQDKNLRDSLQSRATKQAKLFSIQKFWENYSNLYSN